MLSGRFDARFTSLKYFLFVSPFTPESSIKRRGRKEKKSCTHKQYQKSIEICLSFPNVKRKLNFASAWVGHLRIHLCLSGADLDCDKEAADMGFHHQQIKLSTEQTFG
ncbi:hypothetical protein AVEN_6439-1 [Araneus ventricosus]|uniref:Uncharacterized protein n=1 Tax=Araneus ventricosus TaxID=182803 RepID=A0A4Y2HSU5_ARAVE|nr:hypothetical protein AVEN_6439-1 [Araneus ventricosus]